jgi:hypothetical protein
MNRAALRRASREVFGYRGVKAKRQRKVDPRVREAFIRRVQERTAQINTLTSKEA